MITYTRWFLAFGLALLGIPTIGVKFEEWVAAMAVAVSLLIAAWATYYLHFQQLFVKMVGGLMSLVVPEGQWHFNATWKGNNLWIENCDPEKNVCIFTEYPKGNRLKGSVTIENYNPAIGVLAIIRKVRTYNSRVCFEIGR